MTIRTDSANRLHVRHGDTELMVGQRSQSETFVSIVSHDPDTPAVSVKLSWTEALEVARHINDMAAKNVIARAQAAPR